MPLELFNNRLLNPTRTSHIAEGKRIERNGVASTARGAGAERMPDAPDSIGAAAPPGGSATGIPSAAQSLGGGASTRQMVGSASARTGSTRTPRAPWPARSPHRHAASPPPTTAASAPQQPLSGRVSALRRSTYVRHGVRLRSAPAQSSDRAGAPRGAADICARAPGATAAARARSTSAKGGIIAAVASQPPPLPVPGIAGVRRVRAVLCLTCGDGGAHCSACDCVPVCAPVFLCLCTRPTG
jgi:hypothetical protein